VIAPMVVSVVGNVLVDTLRRGQVIVLAAVAGSEIVDAIKRRRRRRAARAEPGPHPGPDPGPDDAGEGGGATGAGSGDGDDPRGDGPRGHGRPPREPRNGRS